MIALDLILHVLYSYEFVSAFVSKTKGEYILSLILLDRI